MHVSVGHLKKSHGDILPCPIWLLGWEQIKIKSNMKTSLFLTALVAVAAFYIGVEAGRENNPIMDDYVIKTENLIDSVSVWYPNFQDTYMGSDTYAAYDYISTKIK